MSARPSWAGTRLSALTATLRWKAAFFIVVMCCFLATALGVLVHVVVGVQSEIRPSDRRWSFRRRRCPPVTTALC